MPPQTSNHHCKCGKKSQSEKSRRGHCKKCHEVCKGTSEQKHDPWVMNKGDTCTRCENIAADKAK
ncbi:hypothetical protein SCHPADRAFT_750318 [Schizopora paradoxa]|uniref:Uncharacterized protein n=1 Tax=Schizopora paradoxa TaxID=27342 RepID=A0A0H2R520_9AGAM|nr:hypothetical protein SCHPADRAFT_750318 [Schizopora paradoxa]